MSMKNGNSSKVREFKEEMEDSIDTEDQNTSFEDENMETDESEQMQELGPAMLGLQRVGAKPKKKDPPTQPVQVLNRRGMPARIRKKNKLFYDDIMVNHPHHR